MVVVVVVLHGCGYFVTERNEAIKANRSITVLIQRISDGVLQCGLLQAVFEHDVSSIISNQESSE